MQFAQSTSDVAAKSIPASIMPDNGLANGLRAFITVEGNDVRVRYDGTAPTATVGHLIKAGGVIDLETVQQINQFQFIKDQNAAGNATLSITIY